MSTKVIGVCPCCLQPFETSRIFVSLDTNELTFSGRTTRLTRREAEVAFILAKSSPRYVPRSRLFTLFHGSNLMDDTKTIEVHINHIRKKVVGLGLGIENMKGVGYRLVEKR